MILFLLVSILFQGEVNAESSKQKFNPDNHPTDIFYDLLCNVQVAINTVNYPALSDLLSPETYENVVSKMTPLLLPRIPVNEIVKVTDIDLNHLPMWSFTAKLGELTSSFKTVYSNITKNYLLSEENCFDLIVNKTGLEEELRIQAKFDALYLIIHIEDALKMKNLTDFVLYFTSNASYLTCDGESKDYVAMFKELDSAPTKKLPINENVEVKEVNRVGFDMNFTVSIDRRDVYYMAKYSVNHSRWQIEQESCAEYYPALINTTRLAEWMSTGVVEFFANAVKMLSTKKMDKIASQYTVIECDGSHRTQKSYVRFYHVLYHKQYYDLDDNFNVSNVVFNATSGSLKFVVELNKLSTNEMHVERNNGEYRLTEIKNMKCLNYNNPDMESHKRHGYIHKMEQAEKFADRYVDVMRTGNVGECSSLFKDPYTLSDGFKYHQENWKLFKFPYKFPKMDVVDVQYNGWGLYAFRAEIPEWHKGINFTVHTRFARRKLESEKWFDL